jgi:hypothetical protein
VELFLQQGIGVKVGKVFLLLYVGIFQDRSTPPPPLPPPHLRNFLAVFWIWIRIGSVFNQVSGSGSRRAKMTHKKRKKTSNFMISSAGCFLLRAEGFSCCSGVLFEQKNIEDFLKL